MELVALTEEERDFVLSSRFLAFPQCVSHSAGAT